MLRVAWLCRPVAATQLMCCTRRAAGEKSVKMRFQMRLPRVGHGDAGAGQRIRLG